MLPPAAFYALGAVVLAVIFFKPIVRLIDRVKKLPGGIDATPTPPQSETTTAIAKKEESPVAPSPGDNILVVEGEKVLREQIKALSPEKRDAQLVRMVAALRLAYYLERLYHRIYGSQIAALDYLNPQGFVPVDNLKPFFEYGKADAPELYANDYDFTGWIAFITRENLIVWKESTTVAITDLGRELLKFIPASGYSSRLRG